MPKLCIIGAESEQGCKKMFNVMPNLDQKTHSYKTHTLTVGRYKHVVEVVASQQTKSTENKRVEKGEEGVRKHGVREGERKHNKTASVDQVDWDKQKQVVL